MARVVGLGNQDFSVIRHANAFYVDKTLFIKEWWESIDEVTLITRPRRFGKTLTLDMVDKFFNIQYKDEGDIFEGLNIYKEQTYRNMQGTYPVIFLSLSEIKQGTYEETIKEIDRVIRGVYRQFKDIIGHVTFDEVGLTSSIQYLCELLYNYYDKKVIILLDEYDTPLQEAYINGYWDELIKFMRSFFNSTFKTNKYVLRSLMSGITRVSKESIFSDLNNLTVVSTTSPLYSTYFGFTQKEVDEALKEYDLYDSRDEVKEWYDGFIFGHSSNIYNPWSIINYLKYHQFKPYWVNSSSNGLVNQLMREGSNNIKLLFEDLLNNQPINVELDEEIVFDQLTYDDNAVWSLLLASGYLKAIHVSGYEDGDPTYTLEIVNKETHTMFNKLIKQWFRKNPKNYSDFIRALLNDDVEAMNDYMNELTVDMISYFDTGNKPSKKAPEKFYHGFTLGLLVELRGRYSVKSNPESGYGRSDVIIKPINKDDTGIIMEFKVFNPKKEKNLEETCNNALKQIAAKKYEVKLKSEGITKVKKYAFAFKGKEVLIMFDDTM